MTDEELSAKIGAISEVLASGVSEELADDMYKELMELRSEALKRIEEERNPDIIEERKGQYGSFEIFVNNMTKIMNILRDHRYQDEELKDCLVTDEDSENFFLVLKLLRLQTADDSDSLVDLENYARLIKEKRYGDNS